MGVYMCKEMMGALAKCIKGRCNQHQMGMAITMAGNTSSQYNNPDAYWCPDCDYKTNERVNLDLHSELNHQTTPSPTNENKRSIHRILIMIQIVIISHTM